MEPVLHSNPAFPVGNINAGDGAVGKAVADAHGAVNAAAKVADETLQKAKPVIDRVAEGAHEAVTKVAGVIEPTADWLSAQQESLKLTQQKLLDDARQRVTASPLKTVLIGLAAGMLIGRLLR